MRICFLGTGGSWPTKRRNPLSIAVTSGTTTILLDCGEGTQRQILFSAVSPNKIEAILITHLHGDHFLGLPGLIQTDIPLEIADFPDACVGGDQGGLGESYQLPEALGMKMGDINK